MSLVLGRWRKMLGWVGLVTWLATHSMATAQDRGVPPPSIAARAAVLMNPESGEILFAKEPHLPLPPASTTKVLTALVVLERLNVHSRVQVSPHAASAPPSRIGLRPGEIVLAQDLLYGLMLKSGNDAAETLAEAVGGSIAGFAELMNRKAAQIGARNSHFVNPHGLPDDAHYTTAYDLALIFRHAMTQPLFADIVRTRNATLRIESSNGSYSGGRMVPVSNTNRLLASYEGTQGGKTGFTLKARRCFVGEVDRGGIRLIVSILNSPNSGTLWEDARRLLGYGFARYGLVPPPPVQPEPTRIMVQSAPSGARVAAVQGIPVQGMANQGHTAKRDPAVKREHSGKTPSQKGDFLLKVAAVTSTSRAKSSAKGEVLSVDKQPTVGKKAERNPIRTSAKAGTKPVSSAKTEDPRTFLKSSKPGMSPTLQQKPKRKT